MKFMTVDQLHDDRRITLMLDDPIDRYDASVSQGGGASGLADDFLALFLATLRAGEHLDGNGAVQSEITPSIDHAQPTTPQFPLENVARKFQRCVIGITSPRTARRHVRVVFDSFVVVGKRRIFSRQTAHHHTSGSRPDDAI